MSRTIVAQETDAFAEELVSRPLADLPDGPLEKLDQLIDWEQFREQLLRAWPWALEDGHRGRPSWDVLLMWKLLLVGKNYGNLSYERLEEFGKTFLRVIRFVGTRLVFGPDAKTIHKYRSALADSGLMEEVIRGGVAAVGAARFRVARRHHSEIIQWDPHLRSNDLTALRKSVRYSYNPSFSLL